MGSVSEQPTEFDLPLRGGFAAGLGQDGFDDVPDPQTVDLGGILDDDPSLAFRRTMGMFATGVTVLTTRTGDQVYGMTANAFMSVSLSPPLVLISVDRRARLNGLLHEGVQFGVSVLAESQGALSDHFARRPSEIEPIFDVVHDTPLVQGALAHVIARVVRSYWGGDHSLFLGQVEYAHYGEGTPLLFHSGGYERLLHEAPVLSTLPRELLEPIIEVGTPRSYDEGDVLMRAGEPGHELLVLVEGSVLMQRPGKRRSIGAGEIVGEIEVLAPRGSRTATITAETRVEAIAVDSEQLRVALLANPHAALALLEVLATRLRHG